MIMKLKQLLLLTLLSTSLVGCGGQPSNKTDVGLLYCSSEANSLYQVNVVESELQAKGLSTKRISFSDSNDLAAVLNGSIGSVDTLYIPTDNVCADNAAIINSIVRSKNVPVFAGEENLCAGCGAITLSISYYNIGLKTGQMAVEILNGEKDIKEMAIAYDQSPVKKYNADFCDAMNITVPSDYVMIEGTGPVNGKSNRVNPNKLPEFVIGISQLVSHPALDAATQGFKDALVEAFGERVSFDEQNAAGDVGLCTTIAANFVAKDVDLIMANATPALQAAANATLDIPILGTSVTEYGVALGIDDFTGVTGRNVSGTSDLAPLTAQAEMLADVFADFMK